MTRCPRRRGNRRVLQSWSSAAREQRWREEALARSLKTEVLRSWADEASTAARLRVATATVAEGVEQRLGRAAWARWQATYVQRVTHRHLLRVR
jgi:hypothetical protein